MIKTINNQGRGKFSNIKTGQLKTELNKAMNNQKERFFNESENTQGDFFDFSITGTSFNRRNRV